MADGRMYRIQYTAELVDEFTPTEQRRILRRAARSLPTPALNTVSLLISWILGDDTIPADGPDREARRFAIMRSLEVLRLGPSPIVGAERAQGLQCRRRASLLQHLRQASKEVAATDLEHLNLLLISLLWGPAEEDMIVSRWLDVKLQRDQLPVSRALYVLFREAGTHHRQRRQPRGSRSRSRPSH